MLFEAMGSGGGASPQEVEGATLYVRLLGGMELHLREARVLLDSARAESLLAYLPLHRDAPQLRQRLAFLFWPDSTESQARTNLRHVLHHLRRAVPDIDRFIDVRPRTLHWRPAAPLGLDVAAFEQAVAEGRLEDAVESYTGDLLPDSYDDWVLEERERLAQRYVHAVERLVKHLEEEGRYAEAVRCAERLVRKDPLREEACRLLMRLCDASGDRARALSAYHVCAATLQRELGVEPSEETRAAYDALLSGATEHPVTDRTSPAAPAFVGRRAERSLARHGARGYARAHLRRGRHRQEPAGGRAPVGVCRRRRGHRRGRSPSRRDFAVSTGCT